MDGGKYMRAKRHGFQFAQQEHFHACTVADPTVDPLLGPNKSIDAELCTINNNNFAPSISSLMSSHRRSLFKQTVVP